MKIKKDQFRCLGWNAWRRSWCFLQHSSYLISWSCLLFRFILQHRRLQNLHRLYLRTCTCFRLHCTIQSCFAIRICIITFVEDWSIQKWSCFVVQKASKEQLHWLEGRFIVVEFNWGIQQLVRNLQHCITFTIKDRIIPN